jgi:hypothetical protein
MDLLDNKRPLVLTALPLQCKEHMSQGDPQMTSQMCSMACFDIKELEQLFEIRNLLFAL